MKTINIYTDGACSGNQSRKNTGGWGAVLEYGEHRKELCGGEADTTNNRMEMTALLAALLALKKEGQNVRVFSDSAYLMDCFRGKWYANWEKNGWKTAGKADVGNRDLWERLLAFLPRHNFSFFRVKGHVNPDKTQEEKLRALYEKFLEWNGGGFSYEEFLYVTAMNNRADALANEGIAQIREEADPRP
jgi:ribonuclease HI